MNQSITSIENLSNELFYEIFEYIDGMQLYQAFSNLNYHFQQLITVSYLRLKIYDSKSSQKDFFLNQWKHILNVHRHQIYSIHLKGSLYDEEFFKSTFIFNSSLNHLESIHLWNFDLSILMSILAKLPSLPRLFALIISIESSSINLTDIYRLIFNLSMLKYYKFFTSELDLPVSLPMANEHQWTSIEYLNIDHCCHFHELLTILSYTPQVRRLKFSDDSGGKLNPERFSSISLTNLTSLSIHSYSVSFDEWEIFLRHIHPQLQDLYFLTRSQDINYLNAYRWEEFIRQYLPQLNKFSLQYYEYVTKDHLFSTYPFQFNQFNSTFWIERKWFMNIEMENDEIIYSIKPYKKTWYENCSIEFSKLTQLSIWSMIYENSNEFLIQDLQHVLTLTHIYHLDIGLYQIDLNQLIRILDFLPDIDSLKIRSILFHEQIILSDEEQQIFSSVVEKNKMTKLNLEKMNCIWEFAIFTTLFPSMAYFKVNDIGLKDLLYYLVCILGEIDRQCNDQLRLLCFHVRFIDDELIELLQQIIKDQKLSIDYTIKRELDYIYLQRK